MLPKANKQSDSCLMCSPMQMIVKFALLTSTEWSKKQSLCLYAVRVSQGLKCGPKYPRPFPVDFAVWAAL